MNSDELAPLKKWVHDLNNRVGAILATAELMQMDQQLSDKLRQRAELIESKSIEVRDLLVQISDHYFGR